MGTILSRVEESAVSTTQEMPAGVQEAPPAQEDGAAEVRKREHEEEMRKFKADLATKREARKEAIAALNRKIVELRGELENEKLERQRLESLLQDDGSGSRAEVEGLERQVKALKDVAAIGGEMLRIRELQVNDLKEKIKAIEETGVQYEKEVENMRRLKGLYEERSRAITISHQMEVEREKARVLAAETKLEIAEDKNRALREKNAELQERITALDSTVDKNNNDISELRVQLAGKNEELYNVTSQMTIVNNLFTQVISDPESVERVTRVLEEHHNLVNHLTEKGNINDVASVLMTVADKDHIMTDEEQDIATNLGKVWRLLVELLGHHSKHTSGGTMPESCYKSVDTPSGPKLVISVSQTFLRLKDLILEKNSLVKEVGRLKDLNCHLEKRLVSQESRLVEVAAELHKTWGVVNKLKSQHKALHTNEQVLRYELKHKRLMLNELKQQLEDCREMWKLARLKNNQTEKDWKLLRKEFADRKQQLSSAESGYEESPGDSQDEEDSHKLSDDEPDVHELAVPGKVGIARRRRFCGTQQSTPERCNTPEIRGIQLPPAPDLNEDPSNAIESRLFPSVNERMEDGQSSETTSSQIEDFQINDEPSLAGGTVNSNFNIDVSENSTVDLSSVENLEVTRLSLSDDIIVEMEPTIQLLPWDETLDNQKTPELEEPTNLELCKSPCVSDSSSAEEPITSTAVAGPSNDTRTDCVSNEVKMTTAEEILARREARLQRLEEQCKHLFNKMNNTNKRSDIITSKLVELHEHYGDGRAVEPAESEDGGTCDEPSNQEVENGAQGTAHREEGTPAVVQSQTTADDHQLGGTSGDV